MNHVQHRRRSVTLRWLALSPLLLVGCASTHARIPAELIASSPAIAPGVSDHASASDSAGDSANVPASDSPAEPAHETMRRLQQAAPEPWHEPNRRSMGLPWAPGQVLMQGFLGYTSFDKVSTDGNVAVDGDDGDLDNLFLIGGGGQWKVGGDRMDWGIEGMLSFSARANAAAFVVGGGGAAVAVHVDMFLFDLYGGPFVSTFLGDKVRVYAAAGPLLEWAEWDQSGAFDDSGSGFGAGTYARTGVEFGLPSRTLIGFGLRWSEASVDLGNTFGDLEIDGLQVMFTVSQGL